MNKLYILIFLSLTTLSMSAQDIVSEGQYLQFSGGSKFDRLYDSSIGSQHYRGFVASTKMAYVNNSASLRWWAEFETDGGFYNSINFPSIADRVANQISGGYNFGFSKPLHKFNDRLWLWGGMSLFGRYSYVQILHYSNSAHNYTFLNNIGVNGLLQYAFSIGDRKLILEWFMNIPLATYYMRPGFSINFPEDKLGETGFTSFNQFYEIDSEIRLLFPMKNGNKIALEYHWDYYSLNTSNKVQYGSHGIFVTAYFKLNNK